jgi:outer membrane protein
VARNVGVSLLNTRTSLERLELAGRLEERSRQALELSQLRYDLGLSSIVELTQSQLALVNAEIQMAAARYDLLLQQAILDFHLGSIQ